MLILTSTSFTNPYIIMILLFTIIEILILIAIAVIIAVAIAILIIRINRDKSGGGSSPAEVGLKALRDLETKLAEVKESGSASADDCTEMRNLLSTATSNGVPTLTTNALKSKIDELCPKN